MTTMKNKKTINTILQYTRSCM